VISAHDARARAAAMLAELETKVGKPLALWDGQFGRVGVEDHGDVWTVAWNSVAYLESGDIFAQVLSGPIAVPKDGGPPFVLGTWSTSIDELLAEYRARAAGESSDG
jgi:hypothetical protein